MTSFYSTKDEPAELRELRRLAQEREQAFRAARDAADRARKHENALLREMQTAISAVAVRCQQLELPVAISTATTAEEVLEALRSVMTKQAAKQLHSESSAPYWELIQGLTASTNDVLEELLNLRGYQALGPLDHEDLRKLRYKVVGHLEAQTKTGFVLGSGNWTLRYHYAPSVFNEMQKIFVLRQQLRDAEQQMLLSVGRTSLPATVEIDADETDWASRVKEEQSRALDSASLADLGLFKKPK